MVEVTAEATKQVGEFFKGRDIQPIRIFMNDGGWAGPSLAMALDKSRDTDELYDVDGYQYVVEKEFLEKAKPITIDFEGRGFKLDSAIEIEAAGGCSGCGSDGDDSGCSWFLIYRLQD